MEPWTSIPAIGAPHAGAGPDTAEETEAVEVSLRLKAFVQREGRLLFRDFAFPCNRC